MKASKSLRRRISMAYLIFTLGSTIFFAVTCAIAVEGIEERLVDARLEEVAKWASPRQASGLPVAMPAGVTFHHDREIPVSLRDLPDGVHEVDMNGVGLHVLSGSDQDGRFVVVDHESDYEKVELVVYSLFALAFAGSLLFSLFVGGYIGRRFVNPILALAEALPQAERELPLQDRDDELGVLARALAEHTAELRRFLDRERFITGDVSHELRTPLTIISGAAEILLQQHGNDASVARPAERIYRAASEAAESVSVLLMLARAPARLPRPAVDIAASAQSEVARYQSLVASKAVALSFAGGDSFIVNAPPELCAAAIGNLVRNACQYTEKGSVTVSLGARTVIVEDTGPGLPGAVVAVLSGASASAQDGPSSGTGLGLGLVKRICEYLDATLSVQTRDGGGTRFEIRFNGAEAADDLTRA
ncbi:HAMP domain-containing sensor histidine kinase [Massilia sp. CF038]|uniref:sensor histidine kinase n=1 Tax=Massilia sp. CF038 TaxID=1881045 RepID=UPI000913284D|nr:HAMP domain-containing sensor histidine kinase [Massilia sp. CF038]SHH30555.1 Signal transduction histidine kinase [Massilia sp. CF038]